VLDTAGIRDSDDAVEQEGVRRARERAAGADLVLWVVDARAPEGPPPGLGAAAVWTVANKTDLIAADRRTRNECTITLSHNVSAVTAEGMNALLDDVAAFAGEFFSSTQSLVSRERHRRALEDALAPLTRALGHNAQDGEELIAEELRVAATALGRLTGRVDVEDILDVIFRDFCIGK
jgi:tRNA modification GTPase